jgi:hypothetical protein
MVHPGANGGANRSSLLSLVSILTKQKGAESDGQAVPGHNGSRRTHLGQGALQWARITHESRARSTGVPKREKDRLTRTPRPMRTRPDLLQSENVSDGTPCVRLMSSTWSRRCKSISPEPERESGTFLSASTHLFAPIDRPADAFPMAGLPERAKRAKKQSRLAWSLIGTGT